MEKDAVRQEAFRIFLGGKSVEYKVRHSARAKNISIRISPDSGLEIVIPRGLKTDKLESCLRNRESWITGRLNHYERLMKKRVSISPVHSGQAIFLGQTFDLVPVIRHRAVPAVKISGGKIFATVPDDSPETLTSALEKWYRSQARKIFEERVRAINLKTGFEVSRIFIRSQKTRWGSCSQQGNLSFNWRLVMTPEEVMNYIVVHELAHLKEMNHSVRFWDLVESLCPDYKKHRQWLRENGLNLSLV